MTQDLYKLTPYQISMIANHPSDNKIPKNLDLSNICMDNFRYYNEVDITFILKINKIRDHLYLSSYYASGNKELMDEYQIKHVINLYQEAIKFDDINLYHHIIYDGECLKKEDLLKLFTIIDNAINKKENILIHCEKGHSRSPTLVIAYLMYKYDLSFYDAYDEVSFKRSIKLKEVYATEYLPRCESWLRTIGNPDKYRLKNIAYQTIWHYSGSPIYHTYLFIIKIIKNIF